MKTTLRFLLLGLLLGSSVQAADRWWDGGTANIVTAGNGASGGTLGTWNTTLQNWDQGNTLAHVAWVNASNDTANFGGTAGTITIASGVNLSVNQMKFTTSVYTIGNASGVGTINFTGSYNDTTPAIDTSAIAGGKLTVSSKISGTIAGGLVIKDGNTSTTANRVYLDAASGNDFIGDITMLSGSIHAISALGNASNKIILKGGGIYGNSNPTITYNVTRDLVISANSYIFNNPAANNQVMALASGKTITGTANLAVNQTPPSGSFTGAEVQFLGDMSGYSGTITNQSGIMTIGSSATSAGGWVVNGGTLKLNAANDTNIANGTGKSDLSISSGTLNMNGKSETINGLSGTTGNVQNDATSTASTLTLGDGNATASFGGTIKNNGGTGGTLALTKIGTGTQTLNNAETYTGATNINAGTLALGASGALNSASSVTIASGATFDVSAIPFYSWGSNAGLTATGTASVPAVLKGASDGIVDLGSQPVTLNYVANAFTGDADSPALSVSQVSLNINGPITVVNNSGTPLGAGTYVLIAQASGNIGGSPTLSGLVGGSGIASGTSAVILVEGGNVELVVQGAATTTTTLTRHTGTPVTSTYGDTLQFDVTVTGGSPSGSVELRDGGVNGTLIGSGTLAFGSVTITPVAATTLAAGNYNNLVARYYGDGDDLPSSSSALSPAQVVSAKNLTIPDAATQSKVYDGTNAAIVSGTLTGIVDSDVVTLIGTGTFSSSAVGGPYPVTSTSTLGGAAAANYTLTQPTGLSGYILVVPTWNVATSGSWGVSGNWLNNFIGSGTGVTADFSTQDLTADTTVSLDGARTIGGLIFGDTTPSNTWTVDTGTGGSLTLAVNSGSPVVSTNVATTIKAVVAGTSGLTKTGAATLTLTNANSYTGVTTINNGILAIGGAGTLGGGTYAGGITTNTTFNYSSSAAQTLSGIISGGGVLTKDNSGVLTLNGANTYSGGTTLNAGQTVVGSSGAFGTGPVVLNSGAMIVNSSTGYTIANAITNNGGTLRNFLSTCTNTFSGGMTLTADSAFAFKYHASSEIIDITTTKVTGSFGFTLTDENNSGGTAGSPVLRLSVGGNDYAGNTTIASGTLQINAANALPNGAGKGNVVLNGGTTVAGTLDLNGNNTAINGLSGTTGTVLGTVKNSSATAATLTAGNADTTSAFAGVITGPLALTKTGSGTLTLSNANTYTGVTQVNSGTLTVTGSTASGSAMTVGGATATGSPALTGTGTVAGTVTIAATGGGAAGTVAPGTVGGIGTLNTGATTISGTYACDINDTTSDLLASTGALTLSGATLTINALVTPTAASYTLATCTGTPAAFTTVNNLPAGYALKYSAGSIQLVKGGFDTWASGKGLDGTAGHENGPLDDPNHNGISNVLEYVLNGEPLTAGSPNTILPTLNASGSNFVFTFTRRVESDADTTQVFEYGSNLSGWTDLRISAPTDTQVTVGTPNGGTPNLQTVTVTVAKGANTVMFGRLKVSRP